MLLLVTKLDSTDLPWDEALNNPSKNYKIISKFEREAVRETHKYHDQLKCLYFPFEDEDLTKISPIKSEMEISALQETIIIITIPERFSLLPSIVWHLKCFIFLIVTSFCVYECHTCVLVLIL